MPIAQQVRHCPSVEVGDDLIPTVLMPAWMDETCLWHSPPDRLGDGEIERFAADGSQVSVNAVL
jgi:hypothetical protein